MPHFTVELFEDTYDGDVEAKLISGLAGAVSEVFGEGFRQLAAVDLFGVPRGRRGVGGVAIEQEAPVVTLRTREPALAGGIVPDSAGKLITAITEAVVAALGERVRDRITVTLVGVPLGRTGVGGEVG